MPAHSHERAQLMYAAAGSITVKTNEGSWVLPPHRALWIPGRFQHALQFSRDVEITTLYVAQECSNKPSWQTCIIIAVPPLIRELILEIVKIPWNALEAGPNARLADVLVERLSFLPQHPVHLPEPQDPRARKFTQIFYNNPTERRPLPEICQEIGVNLRTLERIFLKQTSLTVGAWCLQMRLVSALEMLANNKSVSETAFAVGYENPSSFIAVFKKAFGTTPTNYFNPDPAHHPVIEH